MQLKSLYIKNFRIFEEFTIPELGRLNLIVGENNSGKSSVLEAIRLYAGSANPNLLLDIIDKHDEFYQIDNHNGSRFPVFNGLFYGRDKDFDVREITIGENIISKNNLKINYAYYKESSDKEGKKLTRITSDNLNSIIDTADIRKAMLISKNDQEVPLFFDQNRNRSSLNDYYFEEYRFDRFFLKDQVPCSYVSTHIDTFDSLAGEWDKIILTSSYEDDIKAAFNFIEKDFEKLSFVELSASQQDRFRNRMPRDKVRIPMVKIAGVDNPLPLKTMGEGMSRILQLAIKIFSAKGGFLLIDEFENGLHYSIQPKVWSWLFKLAEDLDIQIFAVTHSWDCVESFAKIANQQKSAKSFLHRIGTSAKTSDKGKKIATCYDKEKMAVITQSDIEVR